MPHRDSPPVCSHVRSLYHPESAAVFDWADQPATEPKRADLPPKWQPFELPDELPRNAHVSNLVCDGATA